MCRFLLFLIAFGTTLFCSFSVDAQTKQKSQKDLCEQTKILLTSSEPFIFTLSDIYKTPQCFDGKFIRLAGVYRIAFENSDLYDPTGDGSSWVSFDPFYPAIKRCSTLEALKLLERENGGTFGLVAMGIIKTKGKFGHMGGWRSEFQMICLEEIKDLSKSGFVFQSQTPKAQKQILDWYAKKKRE